MDKLFAKRMDELVPSGIRKVNEKALAMERAGETVIHFELGRPDFDTPEYIKNACIEDIKKGDVFYTSNFGTMELRELPGVYVCGELLDTDAYTGGFNLADEYINQKQRFGHWKDTGLRLYGEGVYSLTLMCLELWNAFYNTNDNCKKYLPHRYHPEPFPTDGYVQPYCNSPFENETLAQDIYLDLLYQAKEYVYIFTPYLAIDDEMQHALCMAAQRGVDVRLVTPGIPDKRVVYSLTRSYYEPLIRAGVRIYEYTPGFIHAKSYLVDDRIGIVGTINMDYRSLYLHMECAAMLVECSALQKMKLDCVVTIEKSRRVTLQDCKRRRHSLLWQAILRTISPLL